ETQNFMSGSPGPLDTSRAGSAQFTATHWSVVLTAVQGPSSESSAALETLCRTYWYPLYAYIRRRGHQPSDAQDLPQGLFRPAAGEGLPAGRGSQQRQ